MNHNITTALLPHKHVRFCDSIVALAGYCKRFLGQPRTMDELNALINNVDEPWLGKPTFTHIVFAVYLLFSIGIVECLSDGRIYLLNMDVEL